MELRSLETRALSVPLIEPFVIASGAVTTTRAVLVKVNLRSGNREAVGLGEAAALPPVTACDQPELLADGHIARAELVGLLFDSPETLAGALAERVPSPVLRAGIESACLDAWGRLENKSVVDLLGAGSAGRRRFETDITIPIAEPSHMAALARQHRANEFSIFKIKVGRDLTSDIAALRAIQAAVPDARFRIDANGGYTLADARKLLEAASGLAIECFEQPCARDDLDAQAALTREARVPIVADESLRSWEDLERIVETRSANGINLKLVKLGSLVGALAIGRRARNRGLSIMCGAMVETRLGLTAMLHVAAALDRVEYLDLDTQMLLAEERFVGGYAAIGSIMEIVDGSGLAIEEREGASNG